SVSKCFSMAAANANNQQVPPAAQQTPGSNSNRDAGVEIRIQEPPAPHRPNDSHSYPSHPVASPSYPIPQATAQSMFWALASDTSDSEGDTGNSHYDEMQNRKRVEREARRLPRPNLVLMQRVVRETVVPQSTNQVN
ncbi:hypothetical protein PFISCL1PPCAC_27234, partial [Pristionchus fissidentatus]